MARVFPTVVRRKITRVTIVQGDSAEVGNESIRYDRPEILRAQATQGATVQRGEQIGAFEEVTAGILIRLDEPAALVEALQLELGSDEAATSTAEQVQAIIARDETISTDEALAIVLRRDEVAALAEEVRVQATVTVDTTAAAAEELAIAIIRRDDPAALAEALQLKLGRDEAASLRAENSLVAQVANQLGATTEQGAEISREEAITAPLTHQLITIRSENAALAEEVRAQITASIDADVSVLTEQVATIVRAGEDASAADAVEIDITLATNANAISGGTGDWQNPGNILGQNTSEAVLTATSSGFLNTTSNTSTGTLTVEFPNFNLPDTLNIDQVTWTTYHSGGASGVGLGGSIAVDFQTNFGTGWVTRYSINQGATGSTAGAERRVLNFQDAGLDTWAKVNSFQARAIGSVESGPGTTVLPATKAVQWRYTRLNILASGSY